MVSLQSHKNSLTINISTTTSVELNWKIKIQSPLFDEDNIMSRRTVPQTGNLSALLLCCTGWIFSSIGYADTTEAVTAQLKTLGYEQGETIDRVENYRVDGWNYLDDKHIMIYAGPSKRFLITTMVNCPDLSSVEHIGFTSTVNTLTKFDKLIVRGAGGIVLNCAITEIKTLQKVPTKP
jgi:hypothetical protein